MLFDFVIIWLVDDMVIIEIVSTMIKISNSIIENDVRIVNFIINYVIINKKLGSSFVKTE